VFLQITYGFRRVELETHKFSICTIYIYRK
jgi:hypothetical protein